MRITTGVTSPSTPASHTAGMNGVRLEPCTAVTTSTCSHVGQTQKGAITSVQITPIKASADITDAIRRQRRTAGICYGKGHSSISNAKPLFRAVLSGNLQPQTAHCTISSTHPYISLPNGNIDTHARTHNNNVSTNIVGLGVAGTSSAFSTLHPNLQIISGKTTTSTAPKHGAGQVGGAGYSVIYHKQGKMTTINVQGNSNGNVAKTSSDGNCGGNNSKPTPRQPRLILTHRNKTHTFSSYPEGFSRSISTEQLTSHSKDEGASEHAKTSQQTNVGQPSQTKVNDDRQNSCLTPTTTTNNDNDSVTVSSPRGTTITILPRSTSREIVNVSRSPGLQKSRSLDSTRAGGLQRSNTGPGMPCVQFADSILGAVDSDLRQVYKLCQSKVRYAEFIEQSQPHRLTDTNGACHDGDQSQSTNGQTSLPPSSYRLPHSLVPLSTTTSSPASPSSSPRSVVPGLSNKSTPAGSTSSHGLVTSSRPFATDATEIDYDKPVTIVIETDQTNDSWAKTSRSILKPSAKMDATGDKGHKCTNGTIPTRSVPPYLTIRNSSETALRDPARKGHNLEVDFSRMTTDVLLNNSNRGRLVRFSADHKIHEFVPLEPVTPKSDV